MWSETECIVLRCILLGLGLLLFFFVFFCFFLCFFFFNDTATTEIYTLSLHDALPIYEVGWDVSAMGEGAWWRCWGVDEICCEQMLAPVVCLKIGRAHV